MSNVSAIKRSLAKLDMVVPISFPIDPHLQAQTEDLSPFLGSMFITETQQDVTIHKMHFTVTMRGLVPTNSTVVTTIIITVSPKINGKQFYQTFSNPVASPLLPHIPLKNPRLPQ